MGNEYNEPNSIPKHITWINNRETDLIQNLDPCQAGIANDTHHIIMKDKDGVAFIAGYSGFSGSGISGYLAKFTSANSLAISPIVTDGANVGIGNIVSFTSKFMIEDNTGILNFSPYVSFDPYDPSVFFSKMEVTTAIAFETTLNSVPVTIITPGLFSVIYNWVNETTFDWIDIGNNGIISGIASSSNLELSATGYVGVLSSLLVRAEDLSWDASSNAVMKFAIGNKTPDFPGNWIPGSGCNVRSDSGQLYQDGFIKVLFTAGTPGNASDICGFGIVIVRNPHQSTQSLTQQYYALFSFGQLGCTPGQTVHILYASDPTHVNTTSVDNSFNIIGIDRDDFTGGSSGLIFENRLNNFEYIVSYWLWYDHN